MQNNQKSEIPKIIHYCWFGNNKLNLNAKKCKVSWSKYCPEFKIIEWNESNCDLTSNQYVREAYECKKWAFVSDYIRLKVLYDFGGIYMDTDMEVLKPLDEFLSLNAFSGFESYERIPTGIIGAKKGNRWIYELLQDYNNRQFIKIDGTLDLTTNVKYITEKTQLLYPIKLNNTLQKFEDLVIYPFDCFCAKSLENGKISISNDTYTIHHFSGSWLSPKKKFTKKMISIFGISFVLKIISIKARFTRIFIK